MSTRLGSAPVLRTPRLVKAILVVALVATPVLAFPYVLLDRSASRIDVQTDLAWILLVVHVPSAATAMILGALQFVPRIRARRRVHRTVGRTFLCFGTLAFACAIENALQGGAREYHFLRGQEGYKYQWGAIDTQTVRRTIRRA